MKGKKAGQRAPRKSGHGAIVSPQTSKSPLPPKAKPRGGRTKVAEFIHLSHDLLAEPGELPASYGATRLILLPVEPYLVHVCWEISPEDAKRLNRSMATRLRPPVAVLRFHDVTGSDSSDQNAASFFDVPIDLRAGNWYVHLWSPGRSYFVEMGLRTADTRFFPIARSNSADLPGSGSSSQSDEQYMLVSGTYDLMTMLSPAEKEMLKGGPPPPVRKTKGAKRAPESVPRIFPPPCTLLPSTPPLRRFQSRRKRSKMPDLTEMSERSFMPGISSGEKDRSAS